MTFLKITLKILFIIVSIAVMCLPFLFEYLTFRKDKERKISYKRLRVVLFTAIYIIAVTLVLYFVNELADWFTNLSFIIWLSAKLAIKKKFVYCTCVYGAILLNAAIGFLFNFLVRFVRIGLRKRDLLKPNKKGKISWSKKLERKIIKFFHKETWFFAARIILFVAWALSVIYALVFAAYQLPAIFGAKWIPYNFIKTVFEAGYVNPVITLLGLWQAYYFLAGIRRLREECPELLEDDEIIEQKKEIDLEAIDKEVKEKFKDFYACDLEMGETIREQIATTEHEKITNYIGQAVENDARNPRVPKEIYLNCIDRLTRNNDSMLINGGFFSEFSMYFMRYLAAIIARGDSVIFVCNTDAQTDAVHDYLKTALEEQTSIYCKGFKSDAVDYDNPIWRLVKISGERDVIDEAVVSDNSILVTTLSYLCSTHFEKEHSKFIHLVDTVVFVDTRTTVNRFSRQMSMFNTRLKYICKKNSLLAMNGGKGKKFNVRYMFHPIRYVCFDDTRSPGLDRVLANIMSVNFDSVDIMGYESAPLVRCYRYEGTKDENGKVVQPKFFSTEEKIGPLLNMAVLCLAKGASSVTIFTDEMIPYHNLAESMRANAGQITLSVDENKIKINKYEYNPDNYSVIIAMDSSDNLPYTLRKYISMVSDKPSLVIVFSRPYMFRDYYVDNVDSLWKSNQVIRVPVEEETKRDIAQRILIKANAGGISEEEILVLAGEINSEKIKEYVKQKKVAEILVAMLSLLGVKAEGKMDFYKYFEYSSSRDFDDNGLYISQTKVILRRQGEVFELINGRNRVVMATGDNQLLLKVPRERITQNFIEGQNLLHEGQIYNIQKIDSKHGKIYAKHASAGKNEEVYQYVQDREYRVELTEELEYVYTPKNVIKKIQEGGVFVNDIHVAVFRAPMEVITRGYYDIDSLSLATNAGDTGYHSIIEKDNEKLAKQTYRRYGELTSPFYSSDSIMSETEIVSNMDGAMVMSIRLNGDFGSDLDKTSNLAAVMLNEVIHSMFSSVADSVVVCPVRHKATEDEASAEVLKKHPKLTIMGENEQIGKDGFELMIIEDSPSDLGVISVLMSAGDDILKTLFAPIFKYLDWYMSSGEKSDYLYYGSENEPECFDFDSLHKLSKILGDDKQEIQFVDIETVVEYDVCDFCGVRYPKGEEVIELEDGRRMCKKCAESIVGNNKKVLKAHFDRAKIFLESTYGITLDEDYEICFDSTVKIANTLKQYRDQLNRGSDVPLKSYIDDKKKVHLEYSIPSANLSELLVRELTHIWQLKHLPDVAEDLAAGHMALVGVQYLRFLNQNGLAASRTRYFESATSESGEGYRKLARALLSNPQYNNNPFRYLLEMTGGSVEEVIENITPDIIETGDYGKSYTPENFDRALDGRIEYFNMSRLTETKKAAYESIYAAITAHEPQATARGCSIEDIFEVIEAVQFDHPELFWLASYKASPEIAYFEYGVNAEEKVVLQKRIDEVVPKYLEGIDDSMSAYDVAIRIYSKIINSVDYDTIALNKEKSEGGPARDKIDNLRTIKGVFLDGKVVCEGYARAVQYLLQKCGIECAEVAGHVIKENGEQGELHAWNIVKLDGDYYYMDATWDDGSDTVQAVKRTGVGFDYFNITTDELTRTRKLDDCPTPVPNCDAVKCNYYYHNGLVLDEYDVEKIKEYAQNAAKSGLKRFTFKCSSAAVFEKAFNQLCVEGTDCFAALKAASKADKQIRPDTYYHEHNKRLRTITIKFRYK